MKTYIKNLFKTLSLQVISLLLIFGFVLVYAITFPTAPSGETPGGKFMDYFNRMLVDTGSTDNPLVVKKAVTAEKLLQGDCGDGQAIQGFDNDGNKKCVTISTVPVIPTTRYPECKMDDVTLSNGQIWAACNVGTNEAGETSESYGDYYNFSEAKTICALGYELPSIDDWKLADADVGGSLLDNTLLLPLAGHYVSSTDKWLEKGYKGYYWSSTSKNDSDKNYLGINMSSSDLNYTEFYENKNSVRCIKKSTSTTPIPLITYSWLVGEYGVCSELCGGGTQIRSVVCKGSDGIVVSNDHCDIGTEPKPDRLCNPQACAGTRIVRIQSVFGGANPFTSYPTIMISLDDAIAPTIYLPSVSLSSCKIGEKFNSEKGTRSGYFYYLWECF